MDKNTWLAFLVCIIIYLIWFEYVMPRIVPPEKKPDEPAAKEAAAPDEPKGIPGAKQEAARPSPAGEAAPTPSVATVKEAAPEQAIILDADDLKIRTEWTNVGAALTKLTLKDYYTDISRAENVVLLQPLQDQWRHLTIMDTRARAENRAEQGQALPLDTARYEVAERTNHKVAFRAAFTNGLEVTKTFEVRPGKHDLLLRVTLHNTGENPVKQSYSLIAPAGIMPDQNVYWPYLTSQIAQWLAGNESLPVLERPIAAPKYKTADEIKSEGRFEIERNIAWAAVASNYFATILSPAQDKTPWVFRATSYPLEAKPPQTEPSANAQPTPMNVLAEMTTILFDLYPGQSATQEYLFYAGPKRASELRGYGSLERILEYDYGMFGAITKLFLWILAAFHSVIPNFGLGIIFLTLIVKIVLHPLARKTQVSMYKMQQLQPKITALREKYKHDQKTLGQEQWKMFRAHRVNPLSGCLPMFVQIPVLIALYNGIAYSIEFRQEPFFAWIKDLARPDTLMLLPFNIPLLGNQLNILPLVMVVSWVFQQMTMPKPADPQQAQQQKIMMFMPIIFGFMFYSMPSGLVLYWLTNTVLGIVEQYYIKRSLAKITA